MASAVLAWPGAELEDRLAAEGLCAALVRSAGEWRQHAQAEAVAALPLLEIVRIGDAPAEPLPGDGDRPLAGVRVLDLTRVLAGPTCGRTLAALGALVMRIAGPHLPFIEPLVMDTGHGMLSAHVDLDRADGRDTLRDLARQSDIFCQAYRPGSLAARGFAPEDLAGMRPGLVYVTLSAYGHEGPWAPRRGFDTLVQSASGLADEQGAGGGPRHLPGQTLDYVTGYLAAFGAMTALARRATEGGSYLVCLSLAQTGHWIKALGRAESASDPRDLADPGLADVAAPLGAAGRSARHPCAGLAAMSGPPANLPAPVKGALWMIVSCGFFRCWRRPADTWPSRACIPTRSPSSGSCSRLSPCCPGCLPSARTA